MKSSHCQMTVSGVVKSLGANITEVAPSLAPFNSMKRFLNHRLKPLLKRLGIK